MDTFIILALLSSTAIDTVTGPFLADMDSVSVQDPLLLWPLGDAYYLSEVMAGIPQDNAQCGIQFGGVINLPYTPLYLDGDKFPFVDIAVGQKVFTDFTLTLGVQPHTNLPSGCLFHYRHNGSGTMIKEFMAELTNGDLYAYKIIGNSPPEEIKISSLLPQNSLYFFSMAFEKSTGSFKVYVDGAGYSYNDNFQPGVRLETPGVLRLGGSLDNNRAYFKGILTCLTFNNGIVKGTDKSSILEYCKSTSKWKVYPTDLPSVRSTGCLKNSTTVVKQNYGYFSRINRNFVPSTEAPSASFPVDNIRRCASKCLKDSVCLSFTVQLTGSLKYCSLFTKIHVNGLTRRNNSSYYILNEY